MTISTTNRIVYTAVVAIAIITTSSLYRYTPKHLQQIMKRKHEVQRMRITIANHNKIESGQWIELRCKGLMDYDTNAVWWSGMALVQPGKKHNFTLHTSSVTDVIKVYCKYKGSNGCTADDVLVLESLSPDTYYCGESVGRCILAFRDSGLVEKEYVGMFNQTVGYVPNPESIRRCLWIDCLLQEDQTIGKKHCCGSKCEAW